MRVLLHAGVTSNLELDNTGLTGCAHLSIKEPSRVHMYSLTYYDRSDAYKD